MYANLGSTESDASSSQDSVPLRSLPVQSSGCYSYILVGDNIDKTIRARHMSMEHQNQSLHFFHCYAALDRVNLKDFSNASPIGRAADLPLSTFLPDLLDCSSLRENYAILIGREVVKKLQYFKIFETCLPKHFTHAHSERMSQKSTVVSKVMFTLSV